ncbi:MAG: hypothetical protein K0S39_4090 [Paenibacillus sp.]|jgi:uncharacterized transporter YbjL|nr:hypothetical protein [Paenibacillus sp.]
MQHTGNCQQRIIVLRITGTDMVAAAVDHAAAGSKHAIVSNYLIASDIGAAAGPVLGFMLIGLAGPGFVSWGGFAGLLLTALLVGNEYWYARIHNRKWLNKQGN